jgi:hypothetical protein
MRPARHLQWLLPLLALVVALIWALVSVLADPYGEFGVLPWRRYFEHHQSTPYRLAQDLRQGPHALVFGTSHSATLGSAELGEPTLNLSTSVYGYPECIECFLRGLDQAQWSHVTRIYLLADAHMLVAPPDDPCPKAWSDRSAFLWATFRNLDQLKVLRSFDLLLKNSLHSPSNWITPQGQTVYGAHAPWDGSYDQISVFTAGPDAALSLARVAELARSHGKELVPFFTLHTAVFWRAQDPQAMRRHLHLVTRALGPLVMLGWHKDYSRKAEWFRNATHHGSEATQWEADILKDARARKTYALKEADVNRWVEKLEDELKAK